MSARDWKEKELAGELVSNRYEVSILQCETSCGDWLYSITSTLASTSMYLTQLQWSVLTLREIHWDTERKRHCESGWGSVEVRRGDQKGSRRL